MKMRTQTKKAHKRVRVLAFGTFDLLHLGHMYYLQHAKRLGDELIVIVARDANVKKSKGNFPVQNERTRVQLVGALKCVDKAVLGNEGNIFEKVSEINPDVIAMGYDQKPAGSVVKKELAKRGLRPEIVRLKPFRKSAHKSSILRKRVLEFHQKTAGLPYEK